MHQFSVSVTDASLVEQARSGSTDAFEELVRRHFRAAYAVALAILGNQMDAEDVCQDGFLKALERLDGCRNPDKFAAWLVQIVRNRARNYRAYHKVREAVPLESIVAGAKDDSARDVERSELRGRLEDALGTLSDLQREVVLLHDMEGWKHREIAQALRISEVSARQHLFVARKQLRESLGPQAIKEHLP